MNDKHGLAATLDQMVQKAEGAPGSAVRVTLRHGLRVDVMLKGEQMHVQLSRSNVYPAEQEWRIVLRAMPHAANVEPTKLEHGGRFWLRGHWKHVRKRQGMLLIE